MLLAKFFGVENFLCFPHSLKDHLSSGPHLLHSFFLATIEALLMFMELLAPISSIKVSHGCLLLVKAASGLASVTLGCANGSMDSEQAVAGWGREVFVTTSLVGSIL